ncbi:MAG TPA: hypothetical protein VGP72_03380 [Planctomycetota bacterium]
MRPCSLFIIVALVAFVGCKQPTAVPQKDAAANYIEKIAEKGPVKMTVRISPKQPRLSDMLEMDVSVQAQEGVEVTPPPFGKAMGDFLIRDYVPTRPKAGEKLQTWNFHYQLEPVQAKKHLIRSIPVKFSDKRPNSETKGEPILLETEPIEIEVTSELGDKTPSLADLSPMQTPRALPPAPIWYWLAGAGVLAAVVAGSVLLTRKLKRQRQEAVAPPTPEEIAHEALRRLIAANLHGRGLFKEFYVELTGIVRRYIEGTTGLRAPEQTTEEFLRDMRQRKVFPQERSRQLADFLEAADLVKYAAQEPGSRQVEESIARAQEFVGLPSALRPMAAITGA